MKSDADLTWDESEAPYSVRFKDRYFSAHDGREETQAVFLAGNGLPERWRGAAHFHIAELGFGTGLNFLETLAAWQRAEPENATLHYTSFELYPLSGKEMTRALARWPDLVDLAAPLLAQALDNKIVRFGNVELEIIAGDARCTLRDWQEKADAWYLDGFSPANNPQLWEHDLLRAVYDHTKPGGTFSTYTAAGFVRRNLQEAGFEVQRVKGFANKRERLQGIKRQQPKTKPIIRRAEPSDIEAIKTVLQETWHATYDITFGPRKVDEYCEHWHSLEKLRNRLLDNNSLMLVATSEDRIIATANASIDRHGKMLLKQLYVKPDHQGQRIGGRLYDRLLTEMPDFHTIELEVEPGNKGAIEFYKKRGFAIIQTLDDCGGTGDLIKAHVMMRKRPANDK